VSVDTAYVQGDSLYVELSDGSTEGPYYVRGPAGTGGAATTAPDRSTYPEGVGDYYEEVRREFENSAFHPTHATFHRGASVTYRGKYFRTYFAILHETNLEVFVNYYDHDSRTFGEFISWGIPQAGATDPHAQPSITVSPNGHIIITQEQLSGGGGSHNTPLHIRKSDNPEDHTTWSPITGSPVTNGQSYATTGKIGNTMYIFARNHDGTSDRNTGVIRSFDNADTWELLDGTPIGSSDMQEITDFSGQNVWNYGHLQQLDSALAYILHVQQRDHNLAYPSTAILFTKDGETYGNWEWYISDGDSGFSKDVENGSPINYTEIENYAVWGNVDDTTQMKIADNFVIDGEKLILIAEDGERNSSYQNINIERVFLVIDKNGNIEKQKTLSDFPSFSIDQFYRLYISNPSEGVIDFVAINSVSGRVERWRTKDYGDTYQFMNDIGGTYTGAFSGESLISLVYNSKYGIVSVLAPNEENSNKVTFNSYSFNQIPFTKKIIDISGGSTFTENHKNGEVINLELSQNSILNIHEIGNGEKSTVRVKQDATGNRTLTVNYFEGEGTNQLSKNTFGYLNAIDTTPNSLTRILYERINDEVDQEFLYQYANTDICCGGGSTLPAALEISTDSSYYIGTTFAGVAATVTVDTSLTLSEKGFQYGLSTSLDFTSYIASTDTNSGPYYDTITGLAGSTLYYYRAYAFDATDTVYGDIQSFTTDSPIFSATTDTVYSLSDNSGYAEGTITAGAGLTVTEIGFQYTPDSLNLGFLTGYHEVTPAGTGPYNDDLFGLLADTTYYVRAVGVSTTDTVYGNILSFRTDTTPALTDPSDIAGLKLWLDGADIDGDGIEEGTSETGVSGGQVDDWVDKSANGYNFSRVGSNSHVNLSGTNYAIAVGSSDGFTCDQAASEFTDLHSADATFIIRYEIDVVANNTTQGLVRNIDGSSTSHGVLIVHQDNGGILNNSNDIQTLLANNTSNYTIFNSDDATSLFTNADTYRDIMIITDIDNSIGNNRTSLYHQNALRANQISLNAGPPSTSDPVAALQLFHQNGTFGLDGSVTDVIFYTKALNASERQQIVDYFNDKY